MLLYSNENMVSAAAETGTQRSVYWDVVKGVTILPCDVLRYLLLFISR